MLADIAISYSGMVGAAIFLVLILFIFGWQFYSHHLSKQLHIKIEKTLEHAFSQIKENLFHHILQNQKIVTESLNQFSQQSAQLHQQTLVTLQTSLHEKDLAMNKHIQETMGQTTRHLYEQFDKLNQSTQSHLIKISESVEIKLAKGFEKTTETFSNIIQRLALIDKAQQKITELSKNVVSLQEILTDKRSRGAFGEVQLHVLLQNALPPNSYALQHTLSNGTRADCLLYLPPPTGKIVIDAKFPLENYKKYIDNQQVETIRLEAKQQFKLDIRKHIQDIEKKYIIVGETGDSALMFIPAEAIFAEIHAHHPDLVECAFKARVWLASPSTMMAILTTACAVLKDSATRQQVHLIQEHLWHLAQDFSRFEKRMDNLSRHIQQANLDVEQVHTSAQKISKRFQQIEKVELTAPTFNEKKMLAEEN